jgi:DNA-binding NarL/FixJ family response regulator
MDMNVLVAADSVLLRAGLTRLLLDAGLSVVAEADDATETVRKVRAHRPDVVVLALAVAPRREDLDGAGVLVLADDARAAMRLLGANPRGVGYLIEPDVARFTSAVREVAAGGSVLDPAVVAQVVGRRSRRDALTEREREVLQLMAEGRSNRAIAKTVYLSERAVERHVTAIFGKLRLEPSSKQHRRVLAVLAHLGTSTAVAS